jgi:2-hydroxy-3-keto-5-methylthiopentenyl-1-phosphate phosphatase
MHVTQGFNYKCVRINDVAENTRSEQKNAVQAFLISSIAGSMREIVAFVPVKQSTASTLTDMIRRVITVVQSYGFIVVIVASDNNQINAKAFEQLCGSEDISFGIVNPDFVHYKIFFIFET